MQSQRGAMRCAASRCGHGLRLAAQRRAVATDARSVVANTSFHHGVTHTYYEGNSFGVKFNNTGVRVLVDPWFYGDLVFAEQDWMFRGKKRFLTPGNIDVKEIMAETDLVVISQYLDDHCHMPTLAKLPKDIPVVTNAEAAAKIKPLGYTNVTVVDHGQTIEVAGGKLRITASEGALVGPPWSKRQNGLTFREVASTTNDGSAASLYYEPHCDFVEASVAKLGTVDVVVSPVYSVKLGTPQINYAVVEGDVNIMKLLRLLKPKVLIPLLNNGTINEGPLAALTFEEGSVTKVKQQLAGSSTRLELPGPPGEAVAIAL